jgi:hypothetical protein
MSKVSIDLQNVLRMGKFMDQEPPSTNPKDANTKKSTLYRWKAQVIVCTLQCLNIVPLVMYLTLMSSDVVDGTLCTHSKTE